MKKHFSAVVFSLLLMTVGAFARGDLVFIDAQEVFKKFYKTQMAQDQIRQQADDIKLEREAMEADLAALKEEVEVLRQDARDTALSLEIRQSKRDKLEEKLVELQKNEQEMIEYEQLRVKQLEQQNARMTRKLFDEIHEAVILYSKEMGYAAVIDRSALSRNGLEMVLYVDPKEDITEAMITILNEGHEMMVTDEPSSVVEEQ
jgi:Skp family chaperone for outer membrane proteins